MQYAKLKPPFGWVGGKSRLAKTIVSLMPEHELYVEPFCGGLNVLYAKQKPDNSKYREVINDANKDLINLHRVIKSHPKKLYNEVNKMLISRACFDDIKKGAIKPKNNIEKAVLYLYRLSLSFGSKGENFAMPKSRKPKNIYKDYFKWAERLKGVTIECMDFEKIIKEYDREDAFFYCDPPYYKTESYYRNVDRFTKEDHIRLASTLKGITGKFLLSYNDSDFIRELYKDFNIQTSQKIRYTLGANVHKNQKEVSELFISNY